ncbi:hypothetical protein [Nannocystis pusilla]|uniref:hypothetical protein n=1 Tax=Nannocystis pusilla TaxID=889268 RepID=UPI003DA2E4EC
MTTTNQHTAIVNIRGETDGAVKALKNVTDETTKAKEATEDLDKAQGGLGSKLDAIEGRFAKMNGTIGKVTSILGGAGLVGAAMGAAQALGEMADRAQQIDGVNQALRISIDKARASTMGMVSDFELASTANKALQLGVVKNADEFAKLTSTAAKLGMAMGQDVAQSVSDLTTGIGRQSFEILDNLGIILKAEEAYDIYAQRIGKVASELTDAEKKQAFMTVALERAEEAANKANVSLDTNAAAVIRVGAEWQNLKDDVVTGTTDMIGAYAKWTEAQNAAAEAGKRAWELERAGATDYLKLSETEFAGSLQRLTEMAHQLGLLAFDKAAKPVLNAYKEEQEAYIAEQEMLAKTLIGPALPPGFGEKKKGGKRQDLTASPLDRNRSAADFGAAMAEQLVRDEDQREYNEAFATEIELREQNIAALEQEMALRQQMTDLGLADADEVEELATRKYDAEQALLDFQRGAAATREQVFEIETQKRRKASQEQLRIQAQTQQTELAALQKKQAAYEKYGTAAADVLGNVLIASIDAANGEEFAAAKALAAIAEGIRNQMILVSLKEFALAVASAASYNYPAAAQHAAAGGLAAAAAAAAGGAAAGINASIPDTPPAPSAGGGLGGGDGGRGGGAGGPRGPGGGGEGDDDGVPTSYYDADLWQRRPDRAGGRKSEGQKQSVVVNINAPVVGGSDAEIGTKIRGWIRESERSGRQVRS